MSEGMEKEASIALNGFEIFIKKGLYESEQLIENRFLIDIRVDYVPSLLKPGEFLNYERLAEIAGQEMSKDIRLLEHIADSIGLAIMNEWLSAKTVMVNIEKKSAAFSSVKLDSVSVSTTYRR